MNLKWDFEKKDLLVLLIISIYILTFFKPVISGDGYGHYAILEGVVRDHTLNLKEQTRFNKVTNLHIVYNNATKKYVSPYPFGVALLSSPLYSMSLVLDNFAIFHIKDEFFIRERGDILIHQMSLVFTSLILIFTALLLSITIVKRYVSEEYAALSVLIIFFSSPILRYSTYGLSWTHGIEAGLMSIVLLLILQDSDPIFIGALIGLMTTVRYTSAIFLLPIGIYYLYFKRHSDIGKLMIGATPFFFSLMIYSNLQFGGYFSTGYTSGSSSLIKESPMFPVHIFDLLFNFDKGLIVWTPNLLISIYGLYLLKDDKKWIFLGFLALYVIIYSSLRSWSGGWGFGNRYFTVFFPVFCIGIASFFKNLPKFKTVVYLLTFYTTFLSLLFLAQSGTYDANSFIATVNYWFINGNIAHLPKLVIQKLGIYRFLFNK